MANLLMVSLERCIDGVSDLAGHAREFAVLTGSTELQHKLQGQNRAASTNRTVSVVSPAGRWSEGTAADREAAQQI